MSGKIFSTGWLSFESVMKGSFCLYVNEMPHDALNFMMWLTYLIESSRSFCMYFEFRLTYATSIVS